MARRRQKLRRPCRRGQRVPLTPDPDRARAFSGLLVLGLVPGILLFALSACEDADGSRGDPAARGGGAPSGRAGARGGGPASAGRGNNRPPVKMTTTSVPVGVAPATRRTISQYLESNGVLEAEKDVDIVARVAGPIVKLDVEEGMQVEKDQLLALIDDREYRNRVAAATVTRDEAKLAFDRAETAWASKVISREVYDTARIRLDAAATELKSAEIQLAYTEIRAPFSGLIAIRHIKLAEHVSVNTPLFRISDFNPLWCPIQAPEKDLPRLQLGQRAHLNVEAFPEIDFPARVLRISPVVDAATGTLKVTLEVEGEGKLRPGMFASVFVETDVHESALVIPKSALVLDSIGDTVFIEKDGVAARREVKLGFRTADAVEVLAGLEDGDRVIVLGQDGLSDGTPVSVLDEGSQALSSPAAEPPGEKTGESAGPAEDAARPEGAAEVRAAGFHEGDASGAANAPPGEGDRQDGRRGEGTRGGRGFLTPEILADPQRLESAKQRMRDGGLSEGEIKARLDAARGLGQ